MSDKVEKMIFNPSICGGAGECVEVCKNGVWIWKEKEVSFFGLKIKKRIPYPEHQEKCTLCGRCADICPTGAVRIRK